MKCQKCDKAATFHITEIEGGKYHEVHLCEDHARGYLTQPEAEPAGGQTIGSALAQHLPLGQTAAELAQLDQKSCPVCGITFFQFRNQGRLGCPNDYICFAKELEPLVINIHGETEHVGKRPKRLATGTQQQTELIRLRRELKEAVTKEAYEAASKLRDEIRRIEEAGM